METQCGDYKINSRPLVKASAIGPGQALEELDIINNTEIEMAKLNKGHM